MGEGLRWINFCLLLTGLVAWLGVVFVHLRRRAAPPYLWWLATGAWGATLAVLTINFLVHVTSFPACNPGYFSHAYPIALAAGLTSLAAARAAAVPTIPATRPTRSGPV